MQPPKPKPIPGTDTAAITAVSAVMVAMDTAAMADMAVMDTAVTAAMDITSESGQLILSRLQQLWPALTPMPKQLLTRGTVMAADTAAMAVTVSAMAVMAATEAAMAVMDMVALDTMVRVEDICTIIGDGKMVSFLVQFKI